jgi:hypothetical protein
MPDSRQTPSRLGPSHCGQSCAKQETARMKNEKSAIGNMAAENCASHCDRQAGSAYPIWQRPQEPGFPEHCGVDSLDCSVPEAKTDSFFSRRVEPQCGHFVPAQLLERTSISLSRSHFSQWNS